jgi:hypothetical protein
VLKAGPLPGSALSCQKGFTLQEDSDVIEKRYSKNYSGADDDLSAQRLCIPTG